MSIHVQISDEARQKLEKAKRISTISSFIIAIMTLVLIALVLGFFLLPNLGKDDIQIVTYQSNTLDDEEPQAEKVKTNVQRKPTAPSNAPVKTIVASTASPTSIPTVDAAEPVESLEFGEGDDFGTGWGDGTGFGGGGGAQTAFGRTGGGGLEGTFYDLKQTRSKRDNDIGKFYKSNKGIGPRQGHINKKWNEFLGSRFTDSTLREFYSSPNKLSFSHLVMSPSTRAEEGPKAFGVQKEVDPSAWVVVYEGTIRPEKPGEYQFVGLFDDILLVYVDNRIVLDGSWQKIKSGISKPKMGGTLMRPNGSLIEGEWVRLINGSKVKIIVAESPGGSMGGGLFIRERGKSYKKERGADVLPPFAIGALSKEDVRKLKKIETVGSGNFPIEVNDVPAFFSP